MDAIAELAERYSFGELRVSHEQNLILSDVRIGRESGLDLVEAVVRDHPATKVVMLTVYEDEHFMFQALRAGAVGYLLKRVDGHELVRHLRDVAAGDVVIDPALAGRGAGAPQAHGGAVHGVRGAGDRGRASSRNWFPPRDWQCRSWHTRRASHIVAR